MTKKLTKLLCLTMALLLLTACGAKPADPTVSETVPTTQAAPTEPVAAETHPQETIAILETEDHVVVTSYGNLYFPGDWAPFLQTEVTDGDPCTVLFSAVLETREQPQKLFAVTFGGEAEGAIGAVQTADGTWYAVTAETFSFTPDSTWTDRDINIVFTMQEALNHVLENLDMKDASVLEEDVEPSTQESSEPASGESAGNVDPDDLKLDTPYMELHYPAKWMDYLSIEVTEGDAYSVSYSGVIGSHPAQHLFTVHFGGDQGVSLKTVKGENGEMVEIRIELTELELDGTWSAEERTIITTMQEDLNYLLGKMS